MVVLSWKCSQEREACTNPLKEELGLTKDTQNSLLGSCLLLQLFLPLDLDVCRVFAFLLLSSCRRAFFSTVSRLSFAFLSRASLRSSFFKASSFFLSSFSFTCCIYSGAVSTRAVCFGFSAMVGSGSGTVRSFCQHSPDDQIWQLGVRWRMTTDQCRSTHLDGTCVATCYTSRPYSSCNHFHNDIQTSPAPLH